MGRDEEEKKVISASRRIEMLAFFPDALEAFLRQRCPPERVQSVVLWSKRPDALVRESSVRSCLAEYGQVFLHFTVTGMGGTALEPGIPAMEETLRWIPKLVRFLGDPLRLRIRFDPIVRLAMPDGRLYTNLEAFDRVAEAAAAAGVCVIVTSWMQPYPKAVRRLAARGIVPVPFTPEERAEEAARLSGRAEALGLRLLGCCSEGFAGNACIDGRLLTELHPFGGRASVQRAKGQRPGCRCTESWDIGWYYRCPGGCLYCYANPVS